MHGRRNWRCNFMQTLNIGLDSQNKPFALPLELVTTSLAILAKKRVGKSYTTDVFAEAMMEAGMPVGIIDITGAHWGLKSSADGKSPGYPMVIFGGRHADVPLEENAGAIVARAIVERRFCFILDFSIMSKSAMKRFLIAFLSEFYRLNEEPFHLICDEADRYAPQQPMGDEIALVAAMDDIVSRGGIKGIGVSIVSQRSAKVNKNIVTQCELLVVLRTIHHLDAKTIMEWIEMHATKAEAAGMLASLPTLPVGTAWFWWPGEGASNIFERVKVRRRTTFDSGATPRVGEIRKQPKALAQVDVTKLGADIAATAQRAKDNDPAVLKGRIGLLECQLVLAREEASENQLARMDMAKVAPVPIRVDVSVLTPRDQGILDEIKRIMGESLERIVHAEAQLTGLTRELTVKLAKMAGEASTTVEAIPVRAAEERRKEIVRRATLPLHVQFQMASAQRASVDQLPEVNVAAMRREFVNNNRGGLPQGERRVLAAIAQHLSGVTREQLTVLTGYKKSSRDTYLKKLKQRGLAEVQGDRLAATQSGVAMLGADFVPLPTGDELRAHWLARLPQGERRILEVLIDSPGEEVDRERISTATGYLKSSRDTYIKKLAARELVRTTRGGVMASPTLFS